MASCCVVEAYVALFILPGASCGSVVCGSSSHTVFLFPSCVGSIIMIGCSFDTLGPLQAGRCPVCGDRMKRVPVVFFRTLIRGVRVVISRNRVQHGVQVNQQGPSVHIGPLLPGAGQSLPGVSSFRANN